MRFIHLEKIVPPEPKLGDEREAEGYLLRPKRIMNETRWLEQATWREKYLPLLSEDYSVWVPIGWVNI